jgi:hypothetical protein
MDATRRRSMLRRRLILGLAPALALALPLVTAGVAHADNTPGGGDCGGGAPAITALFPNTPGPGDPGYSTLVVGQAMVRPGGASNFVQFVHATICGVGPGA